MPWPMPDIICVPDAPRRLSPRRLGLRNARASLRSVLRWLLLAPDAAVVRGRRDELALDRSTHALIILEKVGSSGHLIADLLGAVLIAAGAWLLATGMS